MTEQAQADTVEQPFDAALASPVFLSKRGFYAMIEVKVYDELQRLAEIIQSARHEIAELRPDEISNHHIPQATDELDAVVRATEEATETILDAVEKIDDACADLPADKRGTVQDSVTKIYEACNFQDVTGQRVNKVINTMKRIEEGVTGLLQALGDQAGQGSSPIALAAAAPAAEDRDDADLLHGPQLPELAQSQSDIDALFASL